MNKQILKSSILITALFLTPLLLTTPPLAAQEDTPYSCIDSIGKWSGKGQGKLGLVTCKYNGDADIYHLGGDNYQAMLRLKRTSGGPVCFDESVFDLQGTCVNNVLEVHGNSGRTEIDLIGEINNGYAFFQGVIENPKGTITMDAYQK